MEEHLSLKELKSKLRDALNGSGLLTSVKANIRKEFAQTILQGNRANSSLQAHPLSSPQFTGKLQDRVIFSLIFHCLLHKGLSNTISVYLAESGIDHKSYMLSEMDITSALHMGIYSPIYQRLITDQYNRDALLHDDSPVDDRPHIVQDLQASGSLLDYIIMYLLDMIHSKQDACCQTDDSGYQAMEYIDMQLKDIRTYYHTKKEKLLHMNDKTVEEKILNYERECEERYKKNLEVQLAYLRENEFAKLRVEERKKARHDYDIMKMELETDYRRRLESQVEKEKELTNKFQEKEKYFQQSLSDAYISLQRDISELQLKQELQVRQIEFEKQSLESYGKKLKELEISLATRERELDLREQEIHEKYQLIVKYSKLELQTQLCVKDNELHTYKDQLYTLEARVKQEREAMDKQFSLSNISNIIQRNAELELKLQMQESMINANKTEEIQGLTLKVKELTLELENEKKGNNRDTESLKHQITAEVSRYTALESKYLDLEGRYRDLKILHTKLQQSFKTLDSVQRKSSGGGGVNGAFSPSPSRIRESIDRKLTSSQSAASFDYTKRLSNMVDKAINSNHQMRESFQELHSVGRDSQYQFYPPQQQQSMVTPGYPYPGMANSPVIPQQYRSTTSMMAMDSLDPAFSRPPMPNYQSVQSQQQLQQPVYLQSQVYPFNATQGQQPPQLHLQQQEQQYQQPAARVTVGNPVPPPQYSSNFVATAETGIALPQPYIAPVISTVPTIQQPSQSTRYEPSVSTSHTERVQQHMMPTISNLSPIPQVSPMYQSVPTVVETKPHIAPTAKLPLEPLQTSDTTAKAIVPAITIPITPVPVDVEQPTPAVVEKYSTLKPIAVEAAAVPVKQTSPKVIPPRVEELPQPHSFIDDISMISKETDDNSVLQDIEDTIPQQTHTQASSMEQPKQDASMDDDNAAIMEARARVLARRRQKQQRDSEEDMILQSAALKSVTSSYASKFRESSPELVERKSSSSSNNSERSSTSFEAHDETDDSTGW